MSEKNGLSALDYLLKTLKEDRDGSANLSNILGDRKDAFKGEYKEIDENSIDEAWLNLFLDGWIRPISASSPLNSHWFRVTSYGKSQLGMIDDDYFPVFLDPQSTISGLKSTIPNIDPITLKYFEEALWAIKKRLFLSATITLGGASESSILALVEALLDFYSDDSLSAEFDKNNKIKNRFELLLKTMKERNLKRNLLDTFKTDSGKCDDINKIFIKVDTVLQRMFDIYRINRNDAGHPTDIGSDPDITRAEAAMFKKYCKIIYGLISCINEAKGLKGSSRLNE